jgi:hypothetical protein
MGQTLLRELADVSKRLEHEKTQRSFMQRWASTAQLGHFLYATAIATDTSISQQGLTCIPGTRLIILDCWCHAQNLRLV